MNTYTAIDIETSGLRPDVDKIIEIGAVKIVDGKICDKFSRLINPHMPLLERITTLTGITDEMLLKAEESSVVLQDFLDFVGEDTLLGHNILFDYSFIKTQLNRMNIEFEREGIDTLYLSRKLHPGLPSKSLEAMCNYFDIENKKAHRAYDDAVTAATLFQKLLEEDAGKNTNLFVPSKLIYHVKKIEPITNRQKNYLLDLLKYHKINLNQPISDLTKSEASRLIDKIISLRGRMQ